MGILAIDPGYEQSAWVALDRDGIPVDFDITPNEELIVQLQVHHAPHAYSHAVIEQVQSYGMAVGREVFETVWWAGRFHQVLLESGVAVDRMPRRTVKLHLCGQAKAKDANIRQALLDRYGPGKEKAVGTKKAPGPLYGVSKDVWAALAVGVTFRDQLNRHASAA